MYFYGTGQQTHHADSAAYDLETGRKVKAYFNNSMVAHVWAQSSQTFGRSGNGNFYFKERALHSYGSHFVAGYILPAIGDFAGAGAVLLNADSYSVSTGGHLSDARGAVWGRESHSVPELTDLAGIFESGLRGATGSRAEFKRFMIPCLSAHFATEKGWAGQEAVAACYRAAGLSEGQAETRAASNGRKAAKAKADKADGIAKMKIARHIATAKQAARTAPGFAKAEGFKRAKAARHYNWEQARDSWESQARDIFRGAKAAKAKGYTGIATKARNLYKAMRAVLPEFESAEVRRNRVNYWHSESESLRAGLALIATGQAPIAGGRGQSNPGAASASFIFATAAKAARDLSNSLTGAEDSSDFARAPARVMGLEPDAMAARLGLVASQLESARDNAESVEARDKQKAQIAMLKAARDISPAATAETRASVWGKAAQILSGFSPLVLSYSGTTIPAPYKLPGAARVAGWTPEKLRGLYELATQRASDARAEIATAEAAQIKADRKEAFDLWRDGLNVPGRLSKFLPRADDRGRAFVRAVAVTRDDSGQITGGRLETSQGADAPLTHAIRAFKMLKACRDRGRGWKANGKTLRVGHFGVDSISASGDFVAGCHSFAWAEIAALAGRLGLSDIVGADTTESRV